MLRVKAPDMLNNMVEVDETYVGGKLKNKHKSFRDKVKEGSMSRSFNKTAVVGLLERNNKVRTYVWNIDNVLLKDMVRQYVNFGAIVVTDAFNPYKGLDREYKGHEVVNHERGEYVRGEWHTNTVEGFFSILKRGIYGIYHSVSPKHLQRYCDEFAGRFNTRKIKDNERFQLSIQSSDGRLKYNDLIAR